MSLAFSAGTRNATRKGSTLRTAIPVSDWASAYFPSGLNRNRRKYSRRVDAAPGRRAEAGEAPEFEPSHGVVLVGRDCESNAGQACTQIQARLRIVSAHRARGKSPRGHWNPISSVEHVRGERWPARPWNPLGDGQRGSATG